MKLAVLADIHANLPALQTVASHIEAWQPDAVIVAGDVVNRGPRPRECLQFVRQQQRRAGWLLVRGNHEDYVLSRANSDAPRRGPQFEIHRFSHWTWQQLNGHIPLLRKMPFQQSLTGPAGGEIRVTHASMRGNRDGIYPDTTDVDLRRKIQPAPALLCVGHTHRPLVRTLDQTLVVNVGAVGLPFDGDYRAAYAQLWWQNKHWQARIVRLDYDRTRAEQDFLDTGFMADSGPMVHLILDELRTAQSRIYQWTTKYQQPVLDRQISLADSIQQFLAEC